MSPYMGHHPVWCPRSILNRYVKHFRAKSCDNLVGIVLGYQLDDWGSRAVFLAGARNFSLHHCIQTGFGADSAS